MNSELNLNRNLDPRDYPTIKCSKCGCITFNQALVFKRVSGIMTGMGATPSICDLVVHVCTKCGEIFDEDKKQYGLDESEKTDNGTILV